MRYVIYIRVSTKEQGESHLGLDSQLRRCRAYVTSHGGEVMAVFKEIASGGYQAHRPVAMEAIASCKARATTLLVSELDRLGRSLAFLTTVRQEGVMVESVHHGAMSTMVFGMYATMAERERELISLRTKAGMARAREAGVTLGSPAGFGDAGQAANATRRKDAADYHAKVLRIVAAGREEGNGYRQIAERLQHYGFTTQTGQPYTDARLRKLMSEAVPKKLGSNSP